jgi:hypothetical protein
MRGKNRRGPKVALQKPTSTLGEDGVRATSKRSEVPSQPGRAMGTDLALTRFADDMEPYMQELVFRCEHPAHLRLCSPARVRLFPAPSALTTNSCKSLP